MTAVVHEDGVEVSGYALRLVIPLVLVIVGVVLPLMFYLNGNETAGQLRFGAGVTALCAVVGVVAGRFTLRLRYDRAAQTLSVTRRFWFGVRHSWLIPLAEFDCWYYVNDTQSLVLRRYGLKPLRFVLFMGNGGPERVLAWGNAALPDHFDRETGIRVSKRAKRALMLGLGLGIPLLGVAAFVVLLAVYGMP